MRSLQVLKPAAKATVEQGMIAAFELALNHWQYHEELWLRGDAQARGALLESVTAVAAGMRNTG